MVKEGWWGKKWDEKYFVQKPYRTEALSVKIQTIRKTHHLAGALGWPFEHVHQLFQDFLDLNCSTLYLFKSVNKITFDFEIRSIIFIANFQPMLEIESFLSLGSQLFGIVTYFFSGISVAAEPNRFSDLVWSIHSNAPVISQENQEDVTRCL